MGRAAGFRVSGRFYPLLVNIENRTCLVVGGGPVGERKVRGLLRRGARVRLVARDLTEDLKGRAEEGRLQWIAREYVAAQIEGAALVFAATSDEALNRRIAEDAAARSVWCNAATEPERGSFIVPAVLERGALTVAVATDGLSPAAARRLRDELETRVAREWSAYLDFLGGLRTAVQALGLDSSENQRIFREAVKLPLVEWLHEGRREDAVEAVSKVCQGLLERERIERLWEEAWTQRY
jgi:precorrin-2 dehydrogenase/sirohydrochlorin ferrochelatase